MNTKFFLKKRFFAAVVGILISFVLTLNAMALGIGGGTTITIGSINYTFLIKYVDIEGNTIDDSINYEGNRTGTGEFAPEEKTINGYTFEGYYYYDSYDENHGGSSENLLKDNPPTVYTDLQGKDSKDGKGIYTVFMVYKVVSVPQLYTINYNENGGTGTLTDLNSPYAKNSQVVVLEGNAFSREHYVFNGWNTKADGTGDLYYPGDNIEMNQNIILYAQWDMIQYTLTYDANSGNGNAPDPEIYDVNVKAIIKEKGSLNKSGSTFNGWNTKANGTGDAYNPGDKIEMDQNITLYAQWETNGTAKIDDNTISGSGENSQSVEGTQSGGNAKIFDYNPNPMTGTPTNAVMNLMITLGILSFLGLLISVKRKNKIIK